LITFLHHHIHELQTHKLSSFYGPPRILLSVCTKCTTLTGVLHDYLDMIVYEPSIHVVLVVQKYFAVL